MYGFIVLLIRASYWSSSRTAGGPLSSPGPRSGTPNVSNSQIVSIVDDDASVRGAMESLVRSLGLVAFAFESAEDFLGSPRVDDSDCLITDVQMPGMTGLELQDRLIARGSRIPIIFITAFPEKAARCRAKAGGAVAFLEKPFAGGAMIEVLRRALAAYSR
jgi:FixJ family two-component response regulator